MCACVNTRISAGDGRMVTSPPLPKYTHQIAAATTKPSAPITAAESAHSDPAVPSATTTIASPRTMIVKSANRSGTWLACTGIAANKRRARVGMLSSHAIAMPQRTYLAGGSNASDAAQIPIATEYSHA